MDEPRLISVRTEVVLDVLVSSMHAAAGGRASGEGDAWLASVGWHTRAVELERFAPARAEMPWLAELIEAEDSDAVEAVSTRLARGEPLERPEPRITASWLVPGPGGHVRHHLAMRAVQDTGPAGDAERLARKRAWMTGFFRHCCEEQLATAARNTMGTP